MEKPYSFNNRIDAQRQILNIVNSYIWNEKLFGLSEGAINRWITNNPKLIENKKLINLVSYLAESLFFLNSKSQEQVTDDYEKMCANFNEHKKRLAMLLRDM